MSSIEVTVYYGNEKHSVEYDMVEARRMDGKVTVPTLDTIGAELLRASTAVMASLRSGEKNG